MVDQSFGLVIVTLSTAKAEFVALSTVTQEATWTRQLLLGFHVLLELATFIMEDNPAAFCIGRNPVTHAKTKEINIRHHYVWEALAERTIDLKYCPVEIMVADILTKPLLKARFNLLHGIMGLQKLHLYQLMNLVRVLGIIVVLIMIN